MPEKNPRPIDATCGSPWTSRELAELRRNAAIGCRELAKLLDRSRSSVKACAYRQRISLRRRGSRRGSVLGQPRGVAIARQIREDVLSGRVDADCIARRLLLDREAELCPCCSARPVEVPSTGFCHVCHTRRLADAHRSAIAEREAQRDLWQSRQADKRHRDAHASERTEGGCSG